MSTRSRVSSTLLFPTKTEEVLGYQITPSDLSTIITQTRYCTPHWTKVRGSPRQSRGDPETLWFIRNCWFFHPAGLRYCLPPSLKDHVLSRCVESLPTSNHRRRNIPSYRSSDTSVLLNVPGRGPWALALIRGLTFVSSLSVSPDCLVLSYDPQPIPFLLPGRPDPEVGET